MSEIAGNYDGLVIGGGIAGLQAAIDLADQGFKVLVVEKEPSIGGKMISLSKVFPTLDCASCICTPRMAAAAHHRNITILTYSEVEDVQQAEAGFNVKIVEKPRYVDSGKCTGCRLCEYACPVYSHHEYECELGARKAVYVPFTNAIPQLALVNLDECILCGKCERACPTDAINFLQEPQTTSCHVGTVIVATGYKMTPIDVKPQYGGDRLDNVISALQMERLLAPSGPYGTVLRPSDGKIPDSIAYLQCAGSRDRSIGVPYCSRVCCMYAIKQAMLLSGILPLADITIYYMDIRAFGKGYNQFYENAKAMGIEFVKAKVGRIAEGESQDLVVRIEQMEGDGRVEERRHDLVVLSLGIVPSWNPNGVVHIDTAADGFACNTQPHVAPTRTSREGIFVAGVASGPKDIPDSIVEAGAAAMEAAIYLRDNGYQPRQKYVNAKSAPAGDALVTQG